jgi:polyhydroxybutyrate depolymerase
MSKRIIAATLLLLLMVGSTAAQDTTPEITAEPMIEATAESTLPPGALAEFPGAGSYTVRQPYADLERSYRVYIPVSYSETGDPVPLVIVMHGAGGTGAGTESFTGFNTLADTENFIVVYPDGVNNVWNDGRQGDPRVGTVNDVQFLSDVVAFMGESLHIDATRVYATGYSMGGMMAYRLGCERSNRFAAVASVASTMPEYLINRCDGSAPIPLLVFAGTDDPVIPWAGIKGAYLSAAQTIGFWGYHNQCSGEFAVEGLPDAEPTDHTLAMRQALQGCAADMTLYGIYWGGHTWPGHPINVNGLGQTSYDIDATAVIWEFFKAHPMKGE